MTTEFAIRKAIETAQFAAAERLLDTYIAGLQPQQLQHAEHFLTEMKQIAQIARAHLAARLEPLRNSSRFESHQRPATTWTLDA